MDIFSQEIIAALVDAADVHQRPILSLVCWAFYYETRRHGPTPMTAWAVVALPPNKRITICDYDSKMRIACALLEGAQTPPAPCDVAYADISDYLGVLEPPQWACNDIPWRLFNSLKYKRTEMFMYIYDKLDLAERTISSIELADYAITNGLIGEFAIIVQHMNFNSADRVYDSAMAYLLGSSHEENMIRLKLMREVTAGTFGIHLWLYILRNLYNKDYRYILTDMFPPDVYKEMVAMAMPVYGTRLHIMDLA